MDASILLVAREGADRLLAQLESLVAAGLDERTEVVVVDDASGPEVAELLARLDGDVVVARAERPIGRQAALREAALRARGDVCIALAPTTRPEPGFAAPLVRAVRSGAALAVPVLGTVVGEVRGYRFEGDGSLMPVASGETPEVPSLDCIAAPRAFWLDAPSFDALDGHHETRLRRAGAGRLDVVEDSRARRVACGPAVSVVVCTRDREEEASGCVRSLAAAGALSDGCEVIVVDNSSDGGTARVLAPLAEALGSALRIVREPVPGLSRSRNRGAEEARTPVVVYVDDDARPGPGWLEALRDAFADPLVAVAGGPIVGLWPNGLPTGWLPAGLEGYFSILGLGDADLDVHPAMLYGANWGIRRDALLRAGGFDVRLGAGEGGKLPGEETEMAERVASLGAGRCLYTALAAVGHRIGPERVDEGWLALRCAVAGVIQPLHDAHWREPQRHELHRDAARAAGELGALLALDGDLGLDDALQRVSESHLPLPIRMRAARELGRLGAAVARLGEELAVFGDLHLRVRLEHARGFIRKPAFRQPGSAPGRLPAGRRPPAKPRVSVVMTCYRLGDTLDEAVASIAAQTADSLELIVVDDGSDDGSAERVASLAERFPGLAPAAVLQAPSGHPAHARNAGLAIARGSYLMCFDADDAAPRHLVERLAAALDRNPGVAIAYGPQQSFGASGDRHDKTPWSFAEQTQRSMFCLPALFRREVYETVGGMRPVAYEDWDYWIRAAEAGFTALYVPDAPFFYRIKAEGKHAGDRARDAEAKAHLVLSRPHLYAPEQIAWAEGVLAGDEELRSAFPVFACIPPPHVLRGLVPARAAA